MKIKSKDFRVMPGEKLKLSDRPTVTEPFYKSKKQYKELLEEHVEKLYEKNYTNCNAFIMPPIDMRC